MKLDCVDFSAAVVQGAPVEQVLRQRFAVARVQPWPLGQCPLLLCRLAEDARCPRPAPRRLLQPSSAKDLEAACAELRAAVRMMCEQAPALSRALVARPPAKDGVVDLGGRDALRMPGAASEAPAAQSEHVAWHGVCPRGHALSAFAAPRADFFCDVCGADVRLGDRMHGCRRCDWDRCEACQGRAPPRAPAAAPRGARLAEGAAPRGPAAPRLAGEALRVEGEASASASSRPAARRARERQFVESQGLCAECSWSDWFGEVAQHAWLAETSRCDGDAAGRQRLVQAAHRLVVQRRRLEPESRPAAWLWLASGSGRGGGHPRRYRDLCALAPRDAAGQEAERVTVDQIHCDLSRTPPELYAGRGQGPGRSAASLSVAAFERGQAVQRLLVAFSRDQPAIGYCQGLNFVAAALVGVLDEASAFVVFSGLVSRLPRDFYSRSPDRLFACRYGLQEKVRAVLARELPRLAQRVEELALDLNLFLPKWLSVLFASVLPLPVAFRLWDHVLGTLGGGGDTLLCLALALLQRAEAAVLEAADLEDALEALSRVVEGVSESDVDCMLLRDWPVSRLHGSPGRPAEPTKDGSVCGDCVSDQSAGTENVSTALGSSFHADASLQ